MLLTEETKGVFIISATPFRDDGALDLESLDSLTDFYLGHRVNGITLLGMMGEAQKLDFDEAVTIVKRVTRRAGRVPVVVGVSNAGLHNLAKLADTVMQAGAAAVMVAPASGIRDDAGLYGYMATVFDALDAKTPVIFQDYPQSTGVYLSVAAFNRMVDDFPRLIMLKHEDCPGLAKLSRIRETHKRRVSILVGNGGLYYPQELARGADGAMTGFAYPEMLVGVYELFAKGEHDAAEDLFDTYLPLVRHEQQPGIGLALRKEVLLRRGAIKSAKLRAPGPSLTLIDKQELTRLIARLERRLK
jgi:4-hydroxy-tetrahydrodipicolinate synthase